MAILLTQLKDLYLRTRGYHTNRKLIVFESDDWGSIRMPSKEVFQKIRLMGDNPEDDAFLSNDCLENASDLQALFDVISSVTDANGNFPIFTMNFVMANPDFEKIDIDKGVYKYEPFYETYTRYYGENNILEIIKDGYSKKLILPQLHCREHLNVGRWMHDLSDRRADVMLAFENKMIGVGASFHELNRYGYMDAFNTDYSTDEELKQILTDATKMFIDVFGYNSKSFVASCFVWNDSLEDALKENDIFFIQSSPWQYKPVGTTGKYELKRKIHFMGEQNKKKQMYSVRNCSYEPAYNQNSADCVSRCLSEISLAFNSRKPAIIDTHRFNYIGSINDQNREKNLEGLKALLEAIVEKYPDVEFVSSAELFEIMAQEKK